MKTETFDLEFITPAFLCGANQNVAELRPASIRGQLRWWLRVLGADRETEARIFGGVHGTVTASAVVVRSKVLKAVHKPFESPAPMSNRGYLYYFATVSGEKKGIRIEQNAYFAPGTIFRVEILQRHPLSERELACLNQAVECFVRLGALGLRATRGCGVFTKRDDILDADTFFEWSDSLVSKGVIVKSPFGKEPCGSAQDRLGCYLRELRKNNRLSGKGKSALGYSVGRERMSSALRLRPVKVKEGYLPLIVYTDAANSQPSIRNILP